jgi:hypothetical protein
MTARRRRRQRRLGAKPRWKAESPRAASSRRGRREKEWRGESGLGVIILPRRATTQGGSDSLIQAIDSLNGKKVPQMP